MKLLPNFLITLSCMAGLPRLYANFIMANPVNYTNYLGSLAPGDTLLLSAGTYTKQLNLSNRIGTADHPIVIMGEGNATVLLANACCNTVNLTNCAYLVIRNFKIDGQNINYVDGVKAGGGGNAYAHHITLEDLLIVNNGGNIAGDNQTVGISTKCAAWNWVIRRCIIIAAGTGIYLGNSDGTCPFVSGLIENNLVINTRGYNMQIKSQKDGVRAIFPETSNDSQRTIIRYNVWSKDSGGTPIGMGDGSRPCLLMDHLPSTGFGSHDWYEVYGNFFYNNPTEALMQVTGNTTAYHNLFVNHVAPSGYEAVVMNNHDGFPPRVMNFFENTIVTNSDAGGIGLFSPNQTYTQYCYQNAIFSNGTPIAGFKPANTVDNVTDTYNHSPTYLHDPLRALPGLDLYPLAGQLDGATHTDSLFQGFTDYAVDFNGDVYDPASQGAYSGSGSNPGWTLQLDTIPRITNPVSADEQVIDGPDFIGILYPNPASDHVSWTIQCSVATEATLSLCDPEGRVVQWLFDGSLRQGSNTLAISLHAPVPGFYLIILKTSGQITARKILIL